MPISTRYTTLRLIALTEFPSAVVSANIIALSTGDPLKLRLDIVDGSLIDIFLSLHGRYSYHWERRLTAKGDLFRHDNAPHERWRHISTFPKHFHRGQESNVAASHIHNDPEQAIREFLTFVMQKLLAEA